MTKGSPQPAGLWGAESAQKTSPGEKLGLRSSQRQRREGWGCWGFPCHSSFHPHSAQPHGARQLLPYGTTTLCSSPRSPAPTHVQEDFIVHIGVPGALVLHAGVLDTHRGQLLRHKQRLSARPWLPHGPCPALSAPHPRHSAQRPKPQPGTDKRTDPPVRKALTSSWFSNILEPEPSGKHLCREKRI